MRGLHYVLQPVGLPAGATARGGVRPTVCTSRCYIQGVGVGLPAGATAGVRGRSTSRWSQWVAVVGGGISSGGDAKWWVRLSLTQGLGLRAQGPGLSESHPYGLHTD